MTNPRILLVGNPKGLNEKLQKDNFEVIVELDPTKARDRLCQEWFHLNLVYLQQADGLIDPNAISLAMIADKTYPPKIVIFSESLDRTNRLLCGVLTNLESSSPAVAVISEQDGLDAVMNAIKTSISRHCRINDQLEIQPDSHVLDKILSCIKPNSDPILWTTELRDLFCMFLYDRNSVRLELLPQLQDSRRNIATVWAQPMSNKIPQEHPLLVKCGSRERVAQIRDHYETYLFRVTNLRMAGYAQTKNFALVAYPAPGDQMDIYNHDFTDFYRSKVGTAVDNDIGLAIDNFFDQAQKLWYRIRPPDDLKNEDLRGWYMERLGLGDEKRMRTLLTDTIKNAGRYGVRAELKGDKLGIALSTSAKLAFYPDPVQYLYKSNMKSLNTKSNLPRIGFWDLRGSNLCVAKNNVVVLSGYEYLEWGPGVVDVAGIEALLKYDCPEDGNFFDLYNLEKLILSLSSFDEAPVQMELDPSFQKMLEWLVFLRKGYARGLSGHDLQYYYGNLFYITMRVFSAEQTTDLQKLHALLSAAMICYRLEHWNNWIGWPDDPKKPI